LTLRNTTNGAFDLSLEVVGTQNHLWDDLRLGVWDESGAAPDPLPPLLWWTTGPNTLTTLQPGQSVHLAVQLALPLSAGNGDQHSVAVIDLRWHAQGS
jgi:hypothetical protein